MYGLNPDKQVKRLISIGFASILVLMLVLGALALSQLWAMNHTLEKVVIDTSTKITSAYIMRDAIRQRSIALRNARLSSDPFKQEEYAKIFHEIAGKYRDARDKLWSVGMDNDESRIHQELTDLTRASQPYNDQAMRYILDNVDSALIDAEFILAAAMQERVVELLDELIQLEERYAEQSYIESKVNYRNAQYLMAVLTALIFIVGMGIAFFIIRFSAKNTERIQYQASHDSLTGLINRREFEQRLSIAIDTANTENISNALIYLDLDDFKIINDTSGHIAGDQLLMSLPELFHSVVRKTDTVARLGGDEFGILLIDCNAEQAYTVAGKLREVISEYHFTWGSKTFSIGASIGLVSIDDNIDDVSSLLGFADASCYAAKDKGKNGIHIFKLEDIEQVEEIQSNINRMAVG